MKSTDKNLAYLFVRLAMALSMLLHGATRFGSYYGAFIDKTVGEFSGSILPLGLVSFHASLIPIIEFFIGVLLLTGFFTRWALVGASALMLSLIFGMGLLSNWGAVMSQIHYTVIFGVLLIFIEHNKYSLDAKIFK